MDKTKQVILYACTECESTHPSEEIANECFEKCKKLKQEKEERKELQATFGDVLRLNAKDPLHLRQLLIQEYKRVFNVDIIIDLFSPIFRRKDLMAKKDRGFVPLSEINNAEVEGKIFSGFEIKIIGKISGNGRTSFTTLNKKSNGIHIRNDYGSSTKIEQHWYIFLDDFPLIKDRYDKFLQLGEKRKLWTEEAKKINNDCIDYANNRPEVIYLNSLTGKINKLSNDLVTATHLKIKEIRDNYLNNNKPKLQFNKEEFDKEYEVFKN